MRLRRLDLNLLIAFDALLSECSVSRAAERLHLGQSATSAALARLREHFDDPLLVQVGRRLQPTAKAAALLPKVRQTLALARELLEEPTDFDPATCERSFTLAASDYVIAVLMPALAATLARTAPKVRLSLRDLPPPREQDVVSEALEYRRCDLVIVPERRHNPQFPQAPLLEDQWCCMAWSGASPYARGLSLAQYETAEHVVRAFADGRTLGMDELHLREVGLAREVVVRLESFALMPEFIVGTERIATLFRRQAEQLAQRYPLRLWPTPVDFPRALQVMQWHPYQDSDPALAWLRKVLSELARPVAAVAAGLGRDPA
ncbi:LysR family transcriptional regulator [Pseudomonas massiliensis]|uniref:LysR family transcriptional regulator n=1 Tax=Pseudomonas massiliensis TaxID=522492 RepID=UPI00069352E2|nr:LysR family transcriptional regulator [Pseudomonas massiliensis]